MIRLKYVSERITNLNEFESQIRSAKFSANVIVRHLKANNVDEAESLAEQLIEELNALEKYEFMIEKRVVNLVKNESQ